MAFLYTIINSKDYLSKEEFCWNKIMDIISSKLSPKYKVCEGAFVRNVENFLGAYSSRPIFIPVDGRSPLQSGQLFTLIDLENDPDGYTPIYSTDPTLSNASSVDDAYPVGEEEDNDWCHGEKYGNKRFSKDRKGHM